MCEELLGKRNLESIQVQPESKEKVNINKESG